MKNETRAFEFVPVLSLSAVIDSIPHHLAIPLLALDMQGHDLAAARSCSESQLARLKSIMHECYSDDSEPFYDGVENSCGAWKAFMSARHPSFRLARSDSAWRDASINASEKDLLWTRIRDQI